MGGSRWWLSAWSNNAGEVSHGGGGRKRRFTLTKARLDRRWGGEGRGDHCEATDELGNAFSWWQAREVTAELHSSRGGSSCAQRKKMAR